MSTKEMKKGKTAHTLYEDIQVDTHVQLGGPNCEAMVRKDSTTKPWQRWSWMMKTSGMSGSHRSQRAGEKYPQLGGGHGGRRGQTCQQRSGNGEREQTQDRCAVWGLGMEVVGRSSKVETQITVLLR